MENPVCSNPEDFFGNKYNTKSNNLIIIKVTRDNLICLTRNEFKMIINDYTEKPVVIESTKSNEHERDEENRERKLDPYNYFYRLPQTGMWVDHTLKDMYDRKANTFELVKMPNEVSLMRSVERTISGLNRHITSYFQARAISRKSLFSPNIEEKYTVFTDSENEDEIIEENLSEEEVKKTLELAKIEADKRLQKRNFIDLIGSRYDFTSISFSGDSKYLVSGSSDMIMKIWEVDTGICIRTIDEKSNTVSSVSFSTDGKYIANGCYDGNLVKIWDVNSGQCIHRLQGHLDYVRSVSFSADGKYIASGSEDKTVKIWDPQNEECLKTLTGHSNWVLCVAFSTYDKFVASGSRDKTVKIWSEIGTCKHTLWGHSDFVNSVSISPDNKYIASGSDDNTIKIWEVQNGNCLYTLQGHSKRVTCVSFSPDGKYIASGSFDKTVKIWNFENGECVRTLEYPSFVTALSYSPNNKYLAIANGSIIRITRIN